MLKLIEIHESKTDLNEKRIRPPTDMRSNYYHTLFTLKLLHTTQSHTEWFEIGGTVMSTHFKTLLFSQSSGKVSNVCVNKIPSKERRERQQVLAPAQPSLPLGTWLWTPLLPFCIREGTSTLKAGYCSTHGEATVILLLCFLAPWELLLKRLLFWSYYQSCCSTDVHSCLWEGLLREITFLICLLISA